MWVDVVLCGRRCTLAGVFDGHGGDFIVKSIVKHLPSFLEYNLKKLDEKSIKEAVIKFDVYLRNLWDKRDVDNSGSTAVICILEKEDKRKVWMINLGDSRGIIFDQDSGEILVETIDHKPYLPEEKQRIISTGGFVSFSGVYRVNGILAVSRAFGDFGLKPYVSNSPDVYSFIPRQNRVYLMVLATDGLWDVVDKDVPINEIKSDRRSRKILSEILVGEALKKGTLDNTTVLTARI